MLGTCRAKRDSHSYHLRAQTSRVICAVIRMVVPAIFASVSASSLNQGAAARLGSLGMHLNSDYAYFSDSQGQTRDPAAVLMASSQVVAQASADTPAPARTAEHAGSPQRSTPSLFITGVVLDPTDATVAGAKVTLQTKGNEDRSTVTDGLGAFRFDGLNSGTYELQVQVEGFKPAKARLKIGTRPITPLKITLALAEIRETVNVDSGTSGVNTEIGGNLDTVKLD